MGRATWSHHGGTCCRDHDLVAQPETELALEHVPRLVVRMVDVEGSDPVLADLGDPLDEDEVFAGDPGWGGLQVSRPASRRKYGVRAILNRMVQYQTTVDRAFAALADPTRRAVLERLGAGSATISELAEPFGMSLTGMKKHVRLLEEANLVATEKVGRARNCVLVPYAFEGISTWLQRLDRFEQVVQRTKGAR